MTKHFERQIDKLKTMLLRLGGCVEEALERAIQAIETKDANLAQQVIDGDRRIDMMEVDLEEECLHALALYQPVAADLRFVISVVKINSDLERIADLATNIAEQALFMIEEPVEGEVPFDLTEESIWVRRMVKQSLDCLVNNDLELADVVSTSDNHVDELHREIYLRLKSTIREHPEGAERLIPYLSISRYLERIADHAVNIVEDVLYMALGEIRRHRNSPSNDEK
jgi:phosphate transport system protein